MIKIQNYMRDIARKGIKNGGIIIFTSFNRKKESANMEKNGLWLSNVLSDKNHDNNVI